MSEGRPAKQESPLREIIAALAPGADNKQMHRTAVELAKLCGRTLSEQMQWIINDGVYAFQVDFSFQDFVCQVRFCVDGTIAMEAKHKDDLAAIRESKAFCISLIHPREHMYCTARLPKVSRSIGIDVYGQPWTEEKDVARALLSPKVAPLFGEIRCAQILDCFVSPIQLRVRVKTQPLPFLASQIEAFQKLLSAIFNLCKKRQKHG